VADTSSERIDRYLVRTGAAPSRRAAAAMIAAGRVRINGHRCSKGDSVSGGDRVEIAPEESGAGASAPPIAPNAALDVPVLYSDAAILVVNKPGGIPCHPLRAGERGTVMNAVVARFPETANCGDVSREGGLIHRLDNGTSGALMIARTHDGFAAMRSAIRAGKVTRRYLAMVAGALDAARDVDAPIAHHRKSPRRMMVGEAASPRPSRAGRAAMTHIEPLRRVGQYSLVAATPRTGSRHQIRVHLARAGHPIVGDTLYGGPAADSLAAGRFFLHLEEIEFDSPSGRHRVKVRAPLPRDLESLLAGN
jgi:23S rRNA pseudouridine1911/1915/1917 synthase